MTGMRSCMAANRGLGVVVTMQKAAGVPSRSGSQMPAKKNGRRSSRVK
jgi:hypothetical protein